MTYQNSLISVSQNTADLHELIRCEIELSKTSVRAVALACGISYPKLNAALNNQSALDYRDVTRIEGRLGLGFGYFAELMHPSPDRQVDGDACRLLDQALRMARRKLDNDPKRVTLNQFLDWWYANSGRLENFTAIQDRVDLFTPPDDNAPLILPVHTGRRSLASLHFELQDSDHLTQTLKGFNPDTNRSLVNAHLTALQAGEPVISHPQLDEVLPSGKIFKRTYRRVLAPVRDQSGATFIVNYSQDISSS